MMRYKTAGGDMDDRQCHALEQPQDNKSVACLSLTEQSKWPLLMSSSRSPTVQYAVGIHRGWHRTVVLKRL